MKIEKTDKKQLKEKIKELKSEGFTRINCISGVETEKGIEVIYNFSKGKNLKHVRVILNKKKPEIETIMGIIPGAVMLERELSEMFGVKVIGNDFKRQFLPENWKGKPPLRRD